jgi:subtilisin-like proprotein convertase family protein
MDRFSGRSYQSHGSRGIFHFPIPKPARIPAFFFEVRLSMFKRNRRSTRRTYRFERLELRTMMASDVAWNNANWDSLPGTQPQMKNVDSYYRVDRELIGLNISTNKLVIGLNQSSVELPGTLTGDFGLGGRARVYTSSEPITPELVASIGLIPGVAYTAPVFVTTTTGNELTVLDEFIVDLKAGVSAQDFFSSLPEVASYRPVEGTTDQFVGRFAQTTGRQAIDRANLLRDSQFVEWVEPNFYQNWQRFLVPNDPRFGNQWHLNNTAQSGGLADADVDMPEAWDINAGGSPQTVIAVIDDGVQSTHPDLDVWTNPGETAGNGIDDDGNGWIDDIHGWNFVFGTNQSEPQGTDAHGTSVAGVAAARGNNNLGVAGAAYRSQVISIKMFDGNNTASTANIAAALRYAAGITANGLGTWNAGDLVNNSWGGGGSSAAINNALIDGTTIGRNGIGATYLFASGNSGAASVSQPAAQSANIPGVIAVGATTNQGVRSNYSQYGTPLDLVAPSNGGTLAIDTTDRTGADGYASGDYTGTGGTGFGGTSSATPLSSGIAALALAQADVVGVTIRPAEMRSLMRNNTDLIGGVTYDINTGKHIQYGFGRINAQALLSGIGNAEISVVNTTNELPSGSVVDLGSVLSGQFVETDLRIRNQGTQDLRISTIDVPAPFSVVNFTPATLTLGQSLVIRVRFTAGLPGTFAEDMIINSNDADESAFRIRLTGVSVPARISGSVYEDFNNNAAYDIFERGVSGGGFVYLDTNNNGNFDTGESQATIDATGYYAYTSLPDGTYTVRVSLPGWTRTTPNASYTITLNGASDYSIGNDFGFGKDNRFYAFVFEDFDADGLLNGLDLPAQNFVINGGQVTATYSNNTPVPINDLAVNNSLINVPTPGTTIQDINALINLTHTYDSDLAISLIGPDGTRVLLSGNNGGFGDNFTNTIFDDSATNPIFTGTAPFTGTFQPDQPLATFNGLLSGGTWTLEVDDQVGGDVGTILNWSIDITSILSAVSDSNGWALMDVPAGPITAVLQLLPNYQYTVPTDGTHSFTAVNAPIFGRTYGVRVPPLPPTDIALDQSSIPENSPIGTLVGTLSSIDPNRFDTFTYSLVNGTGSTDNARFEIVGDQLFALETFNYETDQSFSVRIRSTDSTNLTYEEVFIISVVNVNEDPLDINLSPSNVDENSPVGRYVGTFSTIDTDVLTDFVFDYQLVSGAGDTHNSSFAIVNGDLQVNGPIDYEVTPTMSIRVRTTDLGGLFYEEILTININNVNETPTQINLSNASLPENQPAGYEIGTLSNNDPDAGDTIVYSLVPGAGSDDNIMFQIVGDKLQSAVTFDFEARSSYNIRLRVTDRGGFFVERAFVITVTDINEPPAAITITNNRIRENLPAGTFVGTVSSTDVDNGDSVTIAIVSGPGGEDNSKFQLVGRDLFSTESFDFESKRLLSILFEATDSSGLSTRQILQIAVTNVNEVPSAVVLNPNAIPENATIGTTIGKFITTDIDGDNVFRYEFVSGTGSDDNSLFNILGDQLNTNATFDFDVKKLYTVRVRAIDLGGLSVEQQLFVNITNVNDPPTAIVISNSSVPENSPIGTVVGSFSTTDADDGDTHTYSFVSGAGDADNTLFAIVGNNLVTRNIFNFESRNSYSIRIQTEDAGGLKFEQLFPISITNVNETPISVRISRRSIAENSPIGTVLGTLSTTDTDTLTDTEFVYSLVSGTGDTYNNLFVISGNQVLSNAPLDFETINKLSIRVRSTDLGGLFTEAAFAVDVTNVNELPTVLNLSGRTILENQPVGTVIGLFSNNDPDFNDSHLYTLEPGAGGQDNLLFDIVGNELRSFQSYDFETKSTYNIRVRVTDRVGAFIEAPFVINILDTNENPNSLVLSANTIAENSPLGTLIGNLAGTDPDAGATLSYSLVSGVGSTDNGSFVLNGTALSSNAAFDFENKKTYSIRARVEDQFGASLERVFQILVTNVNESPTLIAVTPNTINERLPVNSLVGDLSTSDPDAGDTFSYSLVNGTGSQDNGFFTVVGNKLRSTAVFDFDVRSSYSIRVRSIDAGGLPVETPLTIQVLNVNDPPTDISLSNSTIAENQSLVTPAFVGVFGTIDADDFDTYVYSFASGAGSADNSKWSIIGNQLFTNAPLDFELQPSHSIRVRSTDAGGLFFEKAFVITITNVNESPTSIVLSKTTIAENVPVGTTVGSLSTLDPDAGDTFSYALVSGQGSGDNDKFTLVGTQLRTATNVDFETQPNYSIRIRTTDAGGLSLESIFTITVTNVNEVPTAINLSQSAFENQAISIPIGQLSAIDPDASDVVTFSKVTGTGSNDNALVRVDADGKIYALAPLNFENKPTLGIRVRATDAGGLFLERAFVINVIDQNDTPTDIALTPSSILENNVPGALVGTFTTTDEDLGDNHIYTLVNGFGSTDNGMFTIDGPDLRVNSSLDFETKSSYIIRVRASDPLGASFEKVLNVFVVNQNESPTDIGLSANSLNENLAAGTTIGVLSTTDQDVGETFVYSLVPQSGSSDHTAFTTVGNTLRTTRPLNFEEQSVYNIVIRSTDSGGNSTTKPFSVFVNNLEEAPINLELSNSTISENSPFGSLVGLLSAIDPDLAGPVSFALVPSALDNGQFVISGNQLLSNAVFNFESKSSYQVRVRATDVAGQNVFRDFAISVLDVNEVPTQVILSSTEIAENTANLLVATLSTDDPDLNDPTTYALVSGTGGSDNGSFNIVGNQLFARSAFDFEAKSSYNIRIRATDSANNQAANAFVIRVLDRNDAPTGVVLTPSSLPENAGANRVIGTLAAIDQDAGDSFGYSFASPTSDFTIVGSQLVASRSFDFESLASYTPSIVVRDAAGASITVPVNVQVTDVNERPTNILISNQAVDENLAPGALVGLLSALDVDADETAVYSLVSGSGGFNNASFRINGNRLETNARFNFEKQDLYSVRVRATDKGGLFFEKAFIVTINNIAEFPPFATNDAFRTSFGRPISMNVLANDSGLGADIDPATVRIVTPPTQGSATALPDGRILFTHSVASSATNVVLQYEVQDINQMVSNVGTVTVSFYSAFQNQADTLDVNADQTISPLDVLSIVDYINSHPGGSQLPLNSPDVAPFVDVDGDGFATPLDVLRVVNRLNQVPGGSGEGEAGSTQGSFGDVDAALADFDWGADSSDNLSVTRRSRRRG